MIFSGAVHFTAANNDSGVRDFDMEKFQLSNHFRFPWPVNVSPDNFFSSFPSPLPRMIDGYFSFVPLEIVFASDYIVLH